MLSPAGINLANFLKFLRFTSFLDSEYRKPGSPSGEPGFCVSQADFRYKRLGVCLLDDTN